jgi:hypothetical protein
MEIISKFELYKFNLDSLNEGNLNKEELDELETFCYPYGIFKNIVYRKSIMIYLLIM